MGTSDERKIELDDIIGFFVEIEEIGPNVSMLSSFIEVLFDHIQKLVALAGRGEVVDRSKTKVFESFSAESYHRVDILLADRNIFSSIIMIKTQIINLLLVLLLAHYVQAA